MRQEQPASAEDRKAASAGHSAFEFHPPTALAQCQKRRVANYVARHIEMKVGRVLFTTFPLASGGECFLQERFGVQRAVILKPMARLSRKLGCD